MSNSKRPLVQKNLREFFRDLLQAAMRSQEVESSEETEFYIVHLLERFARTERQWFSRPLALEFLESFHSPAAHRFGKLRHVGDTSLFISGLFMESVHRQLVSADYYTELGRTAYGHLARMSSGVRTLPGDSFAELSERFSDFVRVLAEISFEQLFRGDIHKLRVYTRWMYTHGANDLRWLMRHGVIPYQPGTTRRH